MKNQKGFTLIELAIVLVIIGIILGAVLKGQDLIQNARAKKFVSKVRTWETATWTYLDRKGYFPGDSGRNGIIGDQSSENFAYDITNANFLNPPYEESGGDQYNTITLGSNTFYIFFGYATTATSGKKNVITICADKTCGTAFNTEQISFAEALDNSIDGVADGTTGQVIGSNSSPDTASGGGVTADSATWIATWSSAPSNDGFTAGSTKAIVYYFDAKRE